MDYRDLKGSAPGMRVEDGNLMVSAIPKQAEGYYLCEANNGIGAGLSAVIYISVQGLFIDISYICCILKIKTIFSKNKQHHHNLK